MAYRGIRGVMVGSWQSIGSFNGSFFGRDLYHYNNVMQHLSVGCASLLIVSGAMLRIQSNYVQVSLDSGPLTATLSNPISHLSCFN